jgi:hypothetical protein
MFNEDDNEIPGLEQPKPIPIEHTQIKANYIPGSSQDPGNESNKSLSGTHDLVLDNPPGAVEGSMDSPHTILE